MSTLKWWKGWRLPTLKEFRELGRPGFEGQYWLQLSREESDEQFDKGREALDSDIIMDAKYIKRFIFLVKSINKENESND